MGLGRSALTGSEVEALNHRRLSLASSLHRALGRHDLPFQVSASGHAFPPAVIRRRAFDVIARR